MEMTSYDHGVPCWIDMGTPDIAGAAAFYGSLFGWESEEGPAEAGGYRVATLNGRDVAGLGPQQSPDMPPFWTTYINVDDIAVIATRVGELGGQVIVEPFAVMDAGTMGVFCDTTGAFFSAWQSNQMIGCGVVNETGALGWNELVTTDVDAAITFYSQLFGWEAETSGEGASTYTELKLGGRPIGGMMPKPAMMPAEVPSFWGVYFGVDDTDGAAAKVVELGGSIMMPPMDIAPGRFAVVADPYGATFNIIKMNVASSQ